MGKLLLITRRLLILSRTKWSDKKLLFEALFLTALARAVILLIPFKKYQKYLGVYSQKTSYEVPIDKYRIIKRISWAVNIVSKYTPWESKCLVQAVTAQRMLKTRKIGSTLYLGVNKDKNNLNAHAWLRCGQVIVTGGYNKGAFKVVAKFANEH